MAKCSAKTAFVPIGMIAMIGGCSIDGAKVIEERGTGQRETLNGVSHSGEYAYFKTADGRGFELRIMNPRVQRRMAPFIPLSFGEEERCVALRITGRAGDKSDQPGQRLFYVTQIQEARKIECVPGIREATC